MSIKIAIVEDQQKIIDRLIQRLSFFDDIEIIFKMYRNELGPNQLFYWRSSLYTTNWKEEKYEKNTH